MRILVSVCGDGMGHAIRSEIVIKKLKGDILITAANDAYGYLKKKHNNVVKIYGNKWIYKNNRINKSGTIISFLYGMIFKGIAETFRYYKLIKRFKPDIIISDFESFSHYFGRIMGIKTISIDNIHALLFDKRTPGHVKFIIRFLHWKSDYYIIPSLIKPNARENVFFTAPVIRDKIINMKSMDKGHVLVYQTTHTNTEIIDVLKKSKRKFIVYGMKKTDGIKNIIFKDFNEDEFFDDLSGASYVIVNGGFNVITESLYLGKPVLSIPIRIQYEQEYNAMNIERLGYGKYCKKLKLNELIEFEKRLNEYRKNIRNKFNRNEVNREFFERLYETIKK